MPVATGYSARFIAAVSRDVEWTGEVMLWSVFSFVSSSQVLCDCIESKGEAICHTQLFPFVPTGHMALQDSATPSLSNITSASQGRQL